MWRCKEQNSNPASPWSNNNLPVAYMYFQALYYINFFFYS
jgi:hypothetical protein